MAEVTLENIRKEFDGTVAVKDLTLTVQDGEFVTLLGPSGCGKTTSLRMIAGFIQPTAGRVCIDGRPVSDVAAGIFVPPEERGIGMVFQSYAVWPHMTVFANVAYPLKIARLPRAEIKRRVGEALALVKMAGLEKRYPHQLSGGQQQRVALARALVMNPQVLLLDEPLSNLDAKLREEMRIELKALQRQTETTIIFVTHDQLEAMVLSDRVVVMREGEAQQIGTPEEIYRQPANRFVADFIGVANFILCRRVGQEIQLMDSPDLRLRATPPDYLGDELVLMVRPEEITIGPEGGEVPGVVEQSMFLGDAVEYLVRVGRGVLVRVKSHQRRRFHVGEPVTLTFEASNFFPGDHEGGRR